MSDFTRVAVAPGLRSRNPVSDGRKVERSRGGDWTIVFDGPGSPDLFPPQDCLAVVHTGHGRQDGADDRIANLVDALPDPATALIYTSDAGLRARVHALGARVAGAQALLDEIAAAGDTTEPRASDKVVVPSEPSHE